MRATRLCGLAVLLAVGCDAAEGGGATGRGAGAEQHAPELATGTYRVTTEVDVTALALVPEPAVSYVALIGNLRREPGTTLLGLIRDAGGSAASLLFAAVPDGVER